MMQITTCSDISRYIYTMNNIPLEFVDQHNYLGVCLHNKLSWQPHVNQICHKANRQLGFLYIGTLKSALSTLKNMLIDKLFCHQFNIVQQYGIHIIRMLYIHKVEMIQHRAARFILNKPWHRNERDSITQMIFELSWPTLQHRRKCTRLTLLFKLLHQHLTIPDYYLPSHRHAYPLEIITTQNFYTINPEQIFTSIHFFQNYSRMEQSPNTEFTELDSFTI